MARPCTRPASATMVAMSEVSSATVRPRPGRPGQPRHSGGPGRRPPWTPTTTGCPRRPSPRQPVEPRSAARLLVGPGPGRQRAPVHATVADLPGLLRPGDVLVVNDTRVLPARLDLVKVTGGRAEVLLLEPGGPGGVRVGGAGPAGSPAAGRHPAARDGPPGRPVVEVGSRVDGPRTGAVGSGCSTPRWWSGPGPCRCRPTSTAPRRPRALPDGVLGRPALSGPLRRRPHRRAPLHPGPARRVPGGRGPRGPGGPGHRARHLPAGHRRRPPSST